MKMTCPVCGEDTFVDGSASDVDVVARRRKCKKCNYIFYTLEYEDSEAKTTFTRLDYARKNYKLYRD